jgi:hypothetical protein
MEFLLDDFNEEEDAFEDLIEDIVVNLKANIDVLQGMISCSRSGPRDYTPRSREEYDERLRNDYFSANPLYSAKIFHTEDFE